MSDERMEYLLRDVIRLAKEVATLRMCVKEALNYRPLSTDPYQVYVRDRCPSVIDEWENEQNS
jgi:hypothetical protein